MESLEEILKVVGGLIVGAIYLFGSQIFKSKDEDTPAPPTLPRESAGSDDDAARQRQVQEAIRRKIMQRRQAASTATSSPEPVSAHRERHKQVVEQHQQTHQPAPHVERTPEASEVDDRFSWDTSDNVYDEQLEARLVQIQATKRRAEALRRQAARSTTKVKQVRSTRGSFPAGSVRSVLRDPAVARTAFVYSEVLGKPVGLRPSGSGVD
tara:strand:- start:14418 stop:15047 length:630 start_codon:yes stop_codon:yes gene_type:complete